MKVAFASDHAGFALKQFLLAVMAERGYETVDFGTHSEQSCDYADYAHPAASAIESGQCDFGIAVCGSGNGIAMTLNKHQQIRAAIAWIPEIAALAKQHNNANVLVFPARFISEDTAVKTLDAYLEASFEGGRHQRRIDKIPLK